jgi:voltage-gated potassium channel
MSGPPVDDALPVSEFSEEDLSEDAQARGESRRYQQWVAHSRRPLDILAVVFLVDIVLIWSFPEAPAPWWQVMQGISWVVWGAFAVDYVVRLVLAADRSDFVRSHKLDLAMVLLPMLRVLRVVLLLRKGLASVSTEKIASSVLAIAVVIVFISAFFVWRVEYDAPGSNIHTFRESLWWAVVTVTTVGYGNYYPVTAQGEVFATVLMVVGISLIGTVSASVAAFFVRRPQVADDFGTDGAPEESADPAAAAAPDLASVLARLDAIAAEQSALRAMLERSARS